MIIDTLDTVHHKLSNHKCHKVTRLHNTRSRLFYFTQKLSRKLCQHKESSTMNPHAGIVPFKQDSVAANWCQVLALNGQCNKSDVVAPRHTELR